MAEKKEIQLEDLLAEQSKVATLATVEAVADKPELVRVTPWIPGRGCACRFALTISKRDISKLVLTENRHHCCGKVQRVVEVSFEEGSVLAIADLFADLSSRAASAPSMRSSVSRFKAQRLTRKPGFNPLPVWIGDGDNEGWSGGDGDDGDGWGNPGSGDCYASCYDQCIFAFSQYGKVNPEQRSFCAQYCTDQCSVSI